MYLVLCASWYRKISTIFFGNNIQNETEYAILKRKTLSLIELIFSYLTRRLRIEDKVYDVSKVSKGSLS